MRPAAWSALVALFFLAGCGQPKQAAPADATSQPSPAGGASTSTAESCVETYSPETLADRSFAFDGTVVKIEERQDPGAPHDEGVLPWVTFEVNEWFLGGSEPTVSVWVPGLGWETSAGTVSAKPSTRLLVAGEPRWGGAPLEDAIAWSCGFTQPWSEDVAAEWEEATS